jgi:hypothetical protein
VNLREFLQIKIFRQHHKVISCNSNFPHSRSRLAIVATYPTQDNFWNCVKISKMLFSAGYDVLVVSNSRLTDSQLLELKKYSFQVVERKNIGRDFGAYNHGIKLLNKSGIKLEQLVLLNDSVYYPTEFASWIERTKSNSGFGSLTVNNHFKRHAQSFYLFADASILLSKSWDLFWKRHIPFSSRVWNIEKGEMALSAALRKSRGELVALLQSPEFRSQLSAKLFDFWNYDEKSLNARTLHSSIRHPSFDALKLKLEKFYLVNIQSLDTDKSNRSEYELPDLYQEQFLDYVEDLFNTNNPFWTLGLILPTYFSMPLKKDLMRRMGINLSHILQTPGYTNDEISSIQAEYVKRGTSADIHGLIKRRLFEQGRID